MQYKVALQAALLMAALPADAQQALPNAADAKAPVPPVHYESAFATYQPFGEPEVAAWRELNDEAARAGGHVGIFGGASHAGHGGGKPPATSSAEAQPPVRGAPKAPAATHQH